MSAVDGQRQLGRYRLLAELGRGGMSVVYRAVDTRLDRPVALKTIGADLATDPEFRIRFASEARAASAIDHENVVPLYDFGEADGELYIVMRLVEGVDLSAEISSGHLPLRRVFSLLGQVAAALDELHAKDLVHLDVKPANILLSRSGSGHEHVYLADFGLSLSVPKGLQNPNGDFLGSPSYASPEHLRSQKVRAASDLYSLTCVLFACLAGRPPFIGRVHDVIAGHLRQAIPSLAALTGLPVAIDRVIARGMAGQPEQRYATCTQLIGAARRALTNLDPDTVPSQSSDQDEAPEDPAAVVRVNAAPSLRVARGAQRTDSLRPTVGGPPENGLAASGFPVVGQPIIGRSVSSIPPARSAGLEDDAAGAEAERATAQGISGQQPPGRDVGGLARRGEVATGRMPLPEVSRPVPNDPVSGVGPVGPLTPVGPVSVAGPVGVTPPVDRVGPVVPGRVAPVSAAGPVVGTAPVGRVPSGSGPPVATYPAPPQPGVSAIMPGPMFGHPMPDLPHGLGGPQPARSGSKTLRLVLGLAVLVIAVVAGLLIWRPGHTPSAPMPEPSPNGQVDTSTVPILTPKALPVPSNGG